MMLLKSRTCMHTYSNFNAKAATVWTVGCFGYRQEQIGTELWRACCQQPICGGLVVSSRHVTSTSPQASQPIRDPAE